VLSKLLIALILVAANGAMAAETGPTPLKFLGEPSCNSSSCHGGAGEMRNQCLTWSRLDFHTRSFATLTTARSTRIGETLKISQPAAEARCTVCHAPFQTVPAAQMSAAIDFTKGVSCENCHGAAENWIRSHTRTDYTHADRVQAGMRDLLDVRVRANTCVACHQNVDADLLRAGHPELIFELDGQAVTEPRHWRKSIDAPGPQIWLAGQAAALREMSWQLGREPAPTESMPQRWAALLWLLQQTGFSPGGAAASAVWIPFEPTPDNISRAQQWADQLARDSAAATWSADSTRKCLDALAGTAGTFRAANPPRAVQARRAERLVLALDRLVLGLNESEISKRLDPLIGQLFKDAQSLPDFAPETFAGHLEEFQKAYAAGVK
jgi:hypothetical protein